MLIAHLSDLHVCARAPLSATNAHTVEAIASVLRLSPQPDVVVVTGDIGEGSPDDYALLARYLSSLRMPIYMVPGNHDDREAMRAAFLDHGYLPASGPLNFVVETRPVRLIGLDSLIPGRVEGALDDETLDFLKEALEAAASVPTFILVHHTPLRCGLEEKDSIRLFRGSERLFEILSRHRQVARVLSGHHHRALLGQFGNAVCQVAPPVRYQEACGFGAGRAEAEVELPGFLLHRWIEGAGVATQHCPLKIGLPTA
ncbi:metallophosphoesterase [Microvirga splendida]|uniref:Metallophosphoesterase n=1 Tax=Microvirga splendida TaxID=2795727 RepID=A0ABS0Y4R0_9HYPH|nr:metallophosphoesterase [Microvirga splendida]MBJ6127300.1 metallophosphoesterase [Microvirga splendida]